MQLLRQMQCSVCLANLKFHAQLFYLYEPSFSVISASNHYVILFLCYDVASLVTVTHLVLLFLQLVPLGGRGSSIGASQSYSRYNVCTCTPR